MQQQKVIPYVRVGLANPKGNTTLLPELNRKRKDDLTIEELQQLPAFQKYSEEQLTQLLDTLKCFTRLVLEVHRNGQRKSIELKPIINQIQKAA